MYFHKKFYQNSANSRYTILFKRTKMKILNFFYENPPEHKDIFTRKLTLNDKNTLIKGTRKSGKKSLIMGYLRAFKNEEYLFLDFEDLRFDESSLAHLESFLVDKNIKILIFYGIKKHFIYDFSPLLEHYQIIIASEFYLTHFEGFVKIELDFLDFEEFVSVSKKNLPVNSQVGAFLQNGRSFLSQSTLNEFLQTHFSRVELEILRFVAENLGNEFSANTLYQRLKRTQKISKDSLYKAVDELEEKGVLRFLLHENKRLKKAFFSDFGLKNALCIDKNFKQLFANVILSELFKLKTPIVYDKFVDFYIKERRIAFIPSATLDIDLIKLRAKKILPKALESGILHIVFISLSTEQSFYENGVKFEVVPFDIWALSLD